MRYLRIWISTIALAFLLSSQTGLMQEDSRRELAVLSAENANRLIELARYGNGTLTGAGAWSLDRNILAVGGSIGIWFYDMSNLQNPARLLDLDTTVTGLVFLNEGQYLAYTTSAGTQVMDVDTGSEVMNFPESFVIAAHPNDDHLLIDNSLTITGEGYIATLPGLELWDVTAQERVQSFSPPVEEIYMYGERVQDMAVSPDGRYFAGSYSSPVEDTCGHRTSYVLIWDSAKPEDRPFFLPGAEYVAFSPDSSMLVSAEWNSFGPDIARLHILDLATNETQLLQTIPLENRYWGFVNWFGFDPFSEKLTALTDGVLRSWDLPGQVKIRELELGFDIEEILFGGAGQAVAISRNGLSLWNSDFQKEQALIFDSPLTSAQFLDSGNGLSRIDETARLHLWRVDDMLQLEEVFVSQPITDSNYPPVLSSDGEYLAFSHNNLTQIISTVENQIVSEMGNSTFPIAFSADSTKLALKRVMQTDGNHTLSYVQVWDVAANNFLREFGPYEQISATEGLVNTQLNFDGSWIGIEQQLGYNHNRYTVFFVASGEEVYSYETEAGYATWTPDLKTLLMRAGDFASSLVWPIMPLATEVETGSNSYPYSGSFGSIFQDGTQFFFITSSHFGCGGDSRKLYVHSLPDMATRWSMALPMGGSNSIDGEFNRAGDLIFSVNSLFNANTGDWLVRLPNDPFAIAFSVDDRSLLSNHDGIVRIWGVPSDE